MIYFIPAWYKNGSWHENEQMWYARKMRSEFDDTVKQVQLFHRSSAAKYQIVLLSSAPNLRHFLHRQSVYRANYWSCFDAIQEVRRRKVMLMSYQDLNWPEHIEFEYTAFVVIGRLYGKKYAQIEFGEDGNLIQIKMFQDEKLKRVNTYDDRGFVSYTEVYDDNEQLIYCDYLTEKQVRKMRVYASDGRVEINPKLPNYVLQFEKGEEVHAFSKLKYKDLSELIAEVFQKYISHTNVEDIFCVAMHEQHTPILNRILENRKTILSFFEKRYDIANHPEAISLVENAGYCIADSRENAKHITRHVPVISGKVTDITPYDSRVDLGISQQLSVQKIMIPIDGLQEQVFYQVMTETCKYLLENEHANIHIFTRNAEFGLPDKILEQIQKLLKENKMDEEWAESHSAESDENMQRIFVEQCVDELSVSKCMREQRLVLDLRTFVDVYLQVMAISVGIPQIIHEPSQYVKNGMNGVLIQSGAEIREKLHYYLDNLKNWNQAMVYAYDMSKKYSTGILLDKWKGVIDVLRQD